MIESEKLLEKKLASEIKKLGGWSIKLLSTHVTGLPDRLCLMPGGRIFFAEMKTTGMKASKIQRVIHTRIRRIGFDVFVLDNTQDIKEVLRSYLNE